MKKIASFLFLAAGAVCFMEAAAQPRTVERPDLRRHFEAVGTAGTIVVRRLSDGRTTVVNGERARAGYTPASTFKILNSLIALDAGVVRNVDEPMFKYGGSPYLVDGKPFLPPACNADLDLRTAFKFSCIPVYQELARRIGLPRYREAVRALGYGNGVLDQAPADAFWLEGGYKVTAFEQVEFLARLARGELPFSQAALDATRDIMLIERSRDHTLRGKTGYLFSTRPAIGWFVGWAERGAEVHVFALNLDITDPAHAGARISITRQVLGQLEGRP